MDSSALGFPSQKDTAAWARMLAAARSMDKMQTSGYKEPYEDPQSKARLDMLLPFAFKLYNEKARPEAEIESQQVDIIIEHCGWLARAGGSSQHELDAPSESGATERWDEGRCRREANGLCFPKSPKDLRPLSPDLIGFLLLPQTFAWRRLRDAIKLKLSTADEQQSASYLSEIHFDISAGRFSQDKQKRMQPLRKERFVSAVRDLAPPLVVALPPQWSSPDMTDVLLEALLALLDLGNTRPLAQLVSMLSKADYDVLVQERSCLSQVLDQDDWTRDCANERSLDDYAAFVHLLKQDGNFKGSLADPIATESDSERTVSDAENVADRREAHSVRLTSDEQEQFDGMTIDSDGYTPPGPPQANATSWARMLGAARIVDELQIDGVETIHMDPRTKVHLQTLLPIARALYDEKAYPIAHFESRRIAALVGHCQGVFPLRKLADEDLTEDYKRGAKEPWDRNRCEEMAGKLRIPFALDALRPVAPKAFGFLLIPQSSAWTLFHRLMNRNLSRREYYNKNRCARFMAKAICSGAADRRKVQPLCYERFVDAVRRFAPPPLGALPPRWSSPDMEDVMLEALLALVKWPHTRPLTELVQQLSDREYDVLVEEHTCLLQFLAKGAWTPSCADGRNLGDYTEFVRILRQDGNFRGSLAHIPIEWRRPEWRPPPWFGATSQLPPYPPQTNPAAWARMLAAARGADQIKTDGVREVNAKPLIKARLGTLLPVARELYDEIVGPILQTESALLEATLIDSLNHLPLTVPVDSLDVHLRSNVYWRAKDSWDEMLYSREGAYLRVPRTLETLRPPVSPDLIGVNLIPDVSAWRLLRHALSRSLSHEESLKMTFHVSVVQRFIRSRLQWSAMQLLRNFTFVDAVRVRAPPLVGALPPQWTAAEMTDPLLEALLALIKLPHTPHLADLVEEMSKAEYDILVQEHSCLSQVLEHGDWKRGCAIGRSLGDYKEFVRILRQDAEFKGSLPEIPSKSLPPARQVSERPAVAVSESERTEFERIVSDTDRVAGSVPDARKARSVSLTRDEQEQIGGMYVDSDGLAPSYPPQTDATAWAQMLAAAFGADKIKTDGAREVDANPRTKARLDTLLPITCGLYNQRLGRLTLVESQRIDTLIGHCQAFVPPVELPEEDLGDQYKRGDAMAWSKERCEQEASRLLVPRSLKTLRPMSPNMIGYSLIPQSSAWRVLRAAMRSSFSKAEKRLQKLHVRRIHYNGRHFLAISELLSTISGHRLQSLRNVRFVDEVRKRAPPLVRGLPPHWTSPDATDELLEALQALLKLSRTRPLNKLVNKLSNAEYAFLVQERKCLSRVLDEGIWAANCANGRSFVDYAEFVRVLRREGDFKGSLKGVPPQSRNATASLGQHTNVQSPLKGVPRTSKKATVSRQKAKDSSSSGPAPVADANNAFGTSLLTKRPAMAHDGSDALRREAGKRQLREPLHGWAVKRQRSGAIHSDAAMRQQLDNTHRGIGALTAQRPATVVNQLPDAGGLLMRIDSATVSVVPVVPLAAAGAVAALALVLLFAVLGFRQRPRRVAGGRTRASAEQL